MEPIVLEKREPFIPHYLLLKLVIVVSTPPLSIQERQQKERSGKQYKLLFQRRLLVQEKTFLLLQNIGENTMDMNQQWNV